MVAPRYQKSCQICSNTFFGPWNAKFCSNECVTRNRNRSKFKGGVEGFDYIKCPVCFEPMREISNLHAKMHGFSTPKELSNKFGLESTKCNNIRERMKGPGNPGYKHGGKFSPWSKKSKVHSVKQIKEAKEKAIDNGIRKAENRPSMKEYWLRLGHNLDDAIRLAKENNIRSKHYFIEKYGEEVGLQKWLDKQEKWQSSMKKSGLHSGSSRVANIFFQKIQSMTDFDLKYGKSEVSIRCKDRVVKVDCLLKDKKRIIEFYGDYWHANPNKYKPGDYIRKKLVEDIWKNDNNKVLSLNEVGYSVLIVWEFDCKNNFEIELQRCLRFLDI